MSRARWLAAGVAVGVAGSVWVEHKVRAVATRYSPSGLAGNATARARAIPSEVRAAVAEGREAMRAREAELRGRGGDPAAVAAPPPSPPARPARGYAARPGRNL